MKRILIISGKGGTGKTSVAAAIADAAKPVVLADCDVDAANLHLLAGANDTKSEPFVSGFTAELNSEKCIGCGACLAACRFDAVKMNGPAGTIPAIDGMSCEGCGGCVDICPMDAVRLTDRQAGRISASQTIFGPMVHAELIAGQSNSGKLVAEVRRRADRIAGRTGIEIILIDGSPGIGCPIIASLAGVDLALVVTEPTPSAVHDMKRVLELCSHFKVPAAIIINKTDLNLDIVVEIDALAAEDGIEVVGRLDFDMSFVRAVLAGKPVTQIQPDKFLPVFGRIWSAVLACVS